MTFACNDALDGFSEPQVAWNFRKAWNFPRLLKIGDLQTWENPTNSGEFVKFSTLPGLQRGISIAFDSYPKA